MNSGDFVRKTYQMNIHQSTSTNFYSPEQVSVSVKSDLSGDEEKLGEIALFSAFTIRMLSNLDVNDTSDLLAGMLVEGRGLVEAFLTGDMKSFQLVRYPGYPGSRRRRASHRWV